MSKVFGMAKRIRPLPNPGLEHPVPIPGAPSPPADLKAALSAAARVAVKRSAGVAPGAEAAAVAAVAAAGAGAAAVPSSCAAAAGSPAQQPPKLLSRLREALRVRHYSLRTERSYVDWVRRFIVFHGRRHPDQLGAAEVQAFLTHLAVERSVSSSTQNQAKAALLFLYREVLGLQLPWLDEVIGAKLSRRLPVVLTPSEVRGLLAELSGTVGLVSSLLYGTGMRLLEALRLRVKDIEFERREIVVRDGKGAKDRVTVLPENLVIPLQAHLALVRKLHLRDLQAGRGDVRLPDALEIKYPNAPRQWGWQWVFPSTTRSTDPRSGAEHRHHLHENSVQRAIALAARRAGIVTPCSPHVLRHYVPRRTMSTH
jgi:integron integrase